MDYNNKQLGLTLYSKDPTLDEVFMEMGHDYMSNQPPEKRERFLRSVLDLQGQPDRWLYFLKLRGEYIGFTHLKIDKTDRPGWGWMMEFYIKPEYRMKGMGRYLYENSVKEFKGRVTDLWLTTEAVAIGFWEAMGYRQTGRMADFNEYEIMEAKMVT